MTLWGQMLILASIFFGAKFGMGGSAWWLLPSVLIGMVCGHFIFGDMWDA